MLQTLQTNCVAAGGGPTCNAIPTEDYTVTVDYTVVRNSFRVPALKGTMRNG